MSKEKRDVIGRFHTCLSAFSIIKSLWIWIIFLVLLPSTTYCQSYTQILDSLEVQLIKTEIPDERMKILSDMLKNTIYNDLDKSYDIVVRFENEAIASGDSAEIARSKNFYGMIAGFAGDHFRAIAAYEEAQEWYRAVKDTFMIGMMYNNLGSAYEFQTDRENSIRYFQLAQAYFQSSGNQDWIFNTKTNIAGQYLASNRMLEARQVLQECEVYYKDKEEYEYLAEVLISLAECARALESVQHALPYMSRVESLLDKLSASSLIRYHLLKCDILTEQGHFENAEFHCRKGNELSKSYGLSPFRMKAYETMYNLFKVKGDYAQALYYHEKLQQISDSTLNEMKDDQVLNVMTKYEVREKNKQLELKESELKQSTYQKNLFITLLAVIALLLLLGLFFMRSKLRSNAALTAQKVIVEKSLADKELLLREIHHRVKNNMQVISSLLSIQSRDIKDEVALKAVNDSRNRVRAMALIHQGLYTEEDLRGIKTTEYISKLCNSLFSSYRIDVDRIKLELEVEEILIDVDSIVPIGLILNELITNALKYAFPDDRKGHIRIKIKEQEEGLRLEVSDDGIGISEDRKLANEGSFGMKMIKAFSNKLDAEWDIQSEKGTTVTMLIRKYKVIRS